MDSVRTMPQRPRGAGSESWPITLVLEPAVLDHFRESCADSPDEETGGLLVGTGALCTDALTLPNRSLTDRGTTYAVDAHDLEAVAENRRIGWWHSHVGCSPRPSPGDVVDAPWSTFQVIVSLVAARGLRLSRWWVDGRGCWHDLGEMRWH